MRWPPRLPGPMSDADVRLDPYRATDVGELFAALDDARAWEHIPRAVPASAQQLHDSIRSRLEGGTRLTFVVRSSRRIVGMTSVTFDPADPDGAEIGGTQLAPGTWGTGVNGAAKRLLIRALFEAGASWIQFRTDELNLRSAAAIRKLGAVDLGVRDDTLVRRDGTVRRSRFFRLQKPDSIPGTPTAGTPERGGVLSRRYRLVTIGAFAFVFVTAFENIAVTTIMPVISRELSGASLYAVAFAGPLAASVAGMVIAGNWADRSGVRKPLSASVALFIAGLIVAGTAGEMWTVVIGRLIHGFGGGALVVAIYVVVARFYPSHLLTKIFGAFAAAWVVPSIVGPYIAGVLGETVGWRWVFLGVAILAAPIFAMVIAATGDRSLAATTRAPWSIRRILYAFLLAAAILALSVSSELPSWVGFAAGGAALVISAFAVRPLLPARTLTAARGLPSVILIRSLISAAFFTAEIHLPYLFTSEYGLTASQAGLALTASGVSWAAASWLQGRLGPRLSNQLAIRVGSVAVLGSIVGLTITAFAGLPPWVAIAGWVFSGAGMGLSYPRTSVLVFAYSRPEEQGFNSSAMSMSDAVGPAVALAIAGTLFAIAGSGTGAFGGVFVLTAMIAASVVVLSGRVGSGRPAD